MSGVITTEPGKQGYLPDGYDNTGYSHGAGGRPPPGSYHSGGRDPPSSGSPVSVGLGGQVHYSTGGNIQKPGEIEWMEQPTVPGCVRGLEYLSQIDQLVVKQQVELLEVVTGFETENKYRIFNKVGQQVYFASEESSCCQRQCCGSGRAFVLHITDNNNTEVLRIERKLQCCAGCCWCAGADCCAYLVTVSDGSGNVLGYTRQAQSGWSPRFMVLNPEQEAVGHISGPCCICSCPCTGDIQFPVKGPDQTTKIGEIAKQWTGWAKELFTNADTFSVSFPMDMDVKMKATFLGALFLIDFMYFEDNNDDDK